MNEFENILEEINHNLEWCDDAYQSRCYKRSHDEITRLRAENKRLRKLLDGRDNFIVANGLWHDFVKTIPPKPTAALEGATEKEGTENE